MGSGELYGVAVGAPPARRQDTFGTPSQAGHAGRTTVSRWKVSGNMSKAAMRVRRVALPREDLEVAPERRRIARDVHDRRGPAGREQLDHVAARPRARRIEDDPLVRPRQHGQRRAHVARWMRTCREPGRRAFSRASSTAVGSDLDRAHVLRAAAQGQREEPDPGVEVEDAAAGGQQVDAPPARAPSTRKRLAWKNDAACAGMRRPCTAASKCAGRRAGARTPAPLPLRPAPPKPVRPGAAARRGSSSGAVAAAGAPSRDGRHDAAVEALGSSRPRTRAARGRVARPAPRCKPRAAPFEAGRAAGSARCRPRRALPSSWKPEAQGSPRRARSGAWPACASPSGRRPHRDGALPGRARAAQRLGQDVALQRPAGPRSGGPGTRIRRSAAKWGQGGGPPPGRGLRTSTISASREARAPPSSRARARARRARPAARRPPGPRGGPGPGRDRRPSRP